MHGRDAYSLALHIIGSRALRSSVMAVWQWNGREALDKLSNMISNTCSFFYADEPPEDPSITCWLNPENAEDEKLEYVCTETHPCIDFEDREDHGEDSY